VLNDFLFDMQQLPASEMISKRAAMELLVMLW
jgi:hypothetical protein